MITLCVLTREPGVTLCTSKSPDHKHAYVLQQMKLQGLWELI